MIRGRVVDRAGFEAEIPLRVIGTEGREAEVLVVIDTGFTEYLTMPALMIEDLGLPFKDEMPVILADAREANLKVHLALVDIEGQRTLIDVYAAEGAPLVGMALLQGLRLTIEIALGGAVTAERMV